MNMLKNKPITAISILALSLSLLVACGPSKQEKAEKAQEQKEEAASEDPTVEVVTAEKGKLSTAITVPGELMAYQEVDLFAKINSYVKKLYVDIGSEVHQGQLLVTLEAPEINSQLLEAQSKIKQEQAVFYASKATYDRLFNTSKTPGTVSQNDLEQAEAKKNSDQANVEAAQSAYKVVQANLDYLQIKAPFDGVITTRNINLGAYVGPGRGTDPLLILQDQKHLRLVSSIPENFTGALKDKNEITFTVRSMPDHIFKAQIKRLAGAIDERLRSERLEMDVYNADNKLLPNMYADVNVPLPARDSSFILPKSAVVTSTEKVFVIKVVNHQAVWVDVQKGFQSGDKMEVYGKLNPGDQIVKKASDEIRDGSPVKEGASGANNAGAKTDSSGAKKP